MKRYIFFITIVINYIIISIIYQYQYQLCLLCFVMACYFCYRLLSLDSICYLCYNI